MSRAIMSSEKGFTLLEVVFASAILAIGILGYTSLKVSNSYSWVFAKDLSQAVPFTVGQLEGLQVMGFNDPYMAVDPDTKRSTYVFSNENYVDEFGDSLGIGDLVIGRLSDALTLEEQGWALGVTSASEGLLVDFAPTRVTWFVRDQCPSELTKMTALATEWGGGGKRSLSINQVQVRP